jgi:pimeloyl-ACP methyl ester carboxylesterase
MIIDRGNGTPLVLVPGLQGRWEYLRPAVEALAGRFRVITFPLCGERASDMPFDPLKGLDNYVAQVLAVLEDKHIDRAAICGVSFGGVIGLRFAGCHPERTAALVLASTPAPTFHLRRRHEVYVRMPWVFGPLFLAESPWRLRAEVVTAFPQSRARWSFRSRMLQTLITAPLSLPRMAVRARLLTGADLREDCARVTAPTLIVTGEPRLDFVVPVDGSIEYTRLIPNARAVILERTGHLGTVTRPDAFARLVSEFVDGIYIARHGVDGIDIPRHTAADRGRPDTSTGSGPANQVA